MGCTARGDAALCGARAHVRDSADTSGRRSRPVRAVRDADDSRVRRKSEVRPRVADDDDGRDQRPDDTAPEWPRGSIDGRDQRPDGSTAEWEASGPELEYDESEDVRELISVGRDILVVDDNTTNLVAIEAALAPVGRRLVLARSGIEALARLLEQDFALMILDVAMPGMDGFETARLVRSRARNRATPIIFISGMSWQDDEILKGYELGAFDFLIKPIRPEVLRAKAQLFVQLQERTLELQDKAEQLRAAQTRAHERELVGQRERFEAEARERQMRRMAEDDRRKDEFLAILAHELRNPLQPLQTAVELIDNDPDRPVAERLRAIIRRQVHHIGRLVDDLLDIARFQTGKLELRRELVALGLVVEEAMASTRAAAEARHHAVHLHHDESTALVDGDPVRLVQVVSNLLSNAIKYTPPGGRIDLEVGTHDDRGYIRVRDSGRGIAVELLPRVFDMFVQERTTPDGAGGLGLGLGLAKRLVELHNGTIRAHSDGAGQGATFEVILPRIEPPEDAPVDRDKTPPVTRRLRALVVDDAADLRELVADLLRMKGHDVQTVEDGPSALAMVRSEPPDVALIDIGLPQMDGYEVARRLRAELPPDRLRLIAMTGYGQATDRAHSLEAGFDAHIVKPASAETIMRAIHGKEES
jgi:signal transduction histidine kinase